MWYSANKLLSYNKLLNFVMSHRGGGKTYETKRIAIKNFLKDGSQFIYLRRFKTELKVENIVKFFDDISKEFPGHEFSVKGHTFYIDGKQCGFAYSLTQQVQIRSVPFPKVKTIIFDEFVLMEKGSLRYLNNEVVVFLEVLSTIIRSRNDVRVFCLGNSISYVNPYFEMFKIRVNPTDKKGFYKSPINNQVILELYDSQEFKNIMLETKFGKLIEGTSYGDYAISNTVLMDSQEFIMNKKPNDSEFICSFKFDGNIFGLWFSQKEQLYHFNSQYDKQGLKISVTTDDHSVDYVSLKGIKNKSHIKALKLYYERGLVFYKNQETKRSVYNILKYIGI